MGCALKLDWLPGKLFTERGTFEDYRQLERFHYVNKRPAVRAGIWRVMHHDRVVAVGVLSYPTPSCSVREEVLKLSGQRYARKKIRWLNRNLRTISRVIVHPQFRGVGIASRLVRVMCSESGVKFVEAMAVMGQVVPFFTKGGMRQYEPAEGKPVYYLWDRNGQITK
jgi:GNAT superfamily N-acetyltransferase